MRRRSRRSEGIPTPGSPEPRSSERARNEDRAAEARLTVLVQPRAARNEIVARGGASLRVRVTAPPAGGAANEAVCALLAEALDCPPSAVRIVRGHSARTKLVQVAGLSPDALRVRLAVIAP